MKFTDMKKNNIKMAVLLVSALFSMSSCSLSLLDQDNPNALTKDSFWQTAEDAKANLPCSLIIV